MNDLTKMTKQQVREQVASDTEQYLADGGSIKQYDVHGEQTGEIKQAQVVSKQVKAEIEQFLDVNMIEFNQDAIEFDGAELTIATDDGTQWNYQTGDNSYTGGAYGLQHWAVVTIMPDSTTSEILDEVISQLEDLMNQ